MPLERKKLAVCAAVAVLLLAGPVKADLTVAQLSSPAYDWAHTNQYGPADPQKTDYYSRSQITRISVCYAGKALYVVYMPASDGLSMAVLGTKGDRLAVRSTFVLQPWITVGKSGSPESLMGAPSFGLGPAPSGGCRIVYIDPWKDALACWLAKVGGHEPTEKEYHLPVRLYGGTSQVLLDSDRDRVYLACFARRHGIGPAVYILDLGSKNWEVKPLRVPWGPGPMLWNLHILPSAGPGKDRLFGVISDLDHGHPAVAEIAKAGYDRASPSTLAPYHMVPWAVAKDSRGSVHLIYPAIELNAPPITSSIQGLATPPTGLADSYQTKRGWRTVEVDKLGSTSPVGELGGPAPQRCYPKALRTSDGHLHLVYYAKSRESLVQVVWSDGRWRKWDFAQVGRVVALDAAEVEGKLAVVWADGQAERVYARLVGLEPPAGPGNAEATPQGGH